MTRPYPTPDLDDLLICSHCDEHADTAPQPTEIVTRGPRLMWLCGHCDELNAAEIPYRYRRFVAAVTNDWFDHETLEDLALVLGLPSKLEEAHADLLAGLL
mgnify:CR=1 FL=1